MIPTVESPMSETMIRALPADFSAGMMLGKVGLGKVGLAISPKNHYSSLSKPVAKMDLIDGKPMTREEITTEILNIFSREFEIEQPDLDKDLRETYEFDSVDAIELLLGIERFLNSELTHEEKKMAMGIRTINQIVDYVKELVRVRGQETHA